MLSIVTGYIIDLTLGKRKWLPEPAEGIRWLIKKAEEALIRQFKDLRIAGVILACAVIIAVYFSVRLILWDFGLLHPAFRTLAGAAMIYFALSTKETGSGAVNISRLMKKNSISKARRQLEELIQKDTSHLDSEQISAESIEFIARGTLEGVISVLFYAFLGGVPLVWACKAAHILARAAASRNPRYKQLGWFSERIYRVFIFIPAKISVLLIPLGGLLSRNNFLVSLKAATKYSQMIPEAAFAGALGVRLGGLSYYRGLPVYKPHILDKAARPKGKHVSGAGRIMYATSLLMLSVLLLIHYFWKVY